MRRCLSIALLVCLGIAVAPLTITVVAQGNEEKGKTAAKEERVEGNIHMVDKATKTVTVMLHGKGSTQEVEYFESTKVTFRNKTAT